MWLVTLQEDKKKVFILFFYKNNKQVFEWMMLGIL